MRRIRHAILILTGKIAITPEMELVMALVKTEAAIGDLRNAAQLVLSALRDNATAAQAAVDAADEQAASEIASVTADLAAAVAPPAPPSA